MTPDLMNDIAAAMQPQPPKNAASNYASRLGEACLRKLFYYRTEGQKASSWPVLAQGRMETGKQLEDLCRTLYNRIGMACCPQWRIVIPQISVNDKLITQYQIGYRPDWFLQVLEGGSGGHWVTQGPCEVKTAAAHIFARLSDLDSMRTMWWMRNYIAQLTVYMLASNFDEGWFLFINKENLFDIKVIPLALDMAFAETLLQKAATVNEHVLAEIPPDKLNDASECGRCGFDSLCCPECMTGKGVEVFNDAPLIEALTYLREHAEDVKAINAAEKVVEKTVKAKQGTNLLRGDWLVTWENRPKHYKAQPAKEARVTTAWHKDVIDLTAKDTEE